MGWTDRIGQQNGWTMDDVYALTEQYPEMQLFQYDDFDYILGDFCGRYIVYRFIDWENGTCSFDTEEFCSLEVLGKRTFR